MAIKSPDPSRQSAGGAAGARSNSLRFVNLHRFERILRVKAPRRTEDSLRFWRAGKTLWLSNSWPITVGAEKTNDMKDEATWDHVVDLLLNKRSYAPYFHFKDDREGTEADVVRNWMDAQHPSAKNLYKAIRHCSPPYDPPDVIAFTSAGNTHGFEVTELVDAETVRRIERGGIYELKKYSRSELFNCIRQRVERKARKPFKTACEKSFLLIYSDEPALWLDTRLLSGITVPKSAFFSEIWFILPPEVNIAGEEPKNPHCQIFPIRQL